MEKTPVPVTKSMVGEYDHLEKTDPIGGGFFDLDRFAQIAVEKNYGTVRVLSAIIRAREGSEKFENEGEKGEREDKLVEGLRKLLDDGLY